MTRRPLGRKRALVLGVFRESRSVRPVTDRLRRLDGARCAWLFHVKNERKRWTVIGPSRNAIWLSLVSGLAAAVLAWGIGLPTVFVLAALLLTVVGSWLVWLATQVGLIRRLASRFVPFLLEGEVMAVVSVVAEDLPRALELLTESASERPLVFVLQTPNLYGVSEALIPGAIALGDEASSALALELAPHVRDVEPGPPLRSVRRHVDTSERTIKHVHDRLLRSARLDHGVALSAEWLLDNAYVIQGHVEDFRSNLPSGFYRKLPRVPSGPYAGSSRAYAIACELVTNWDAHLTRESIQTFLHALQSEVVLTSSELWALPLMLRLRLIEHLASLSATVERRQSESEEAAFWANRLLFATKSDPQRVSEIMRSLAAEVPDPTAHFVEELVGHLYDEEAALGPARDWLAPHFELPLDEVIRGDERREASEQVSLANAISTLRRLTQLDWRTVFESVSHLEATLWADPTFRYGSMDFETRDAYRHVIETMSRRSGSAEEEIALAAIALAREGRTELERHVGYYLIDEGRSVLEARLGLRPAYALRVRRFVTRNAGLVYVGLVSISTALVLWLALAVLPGPMWLRAVMGLALAVPASEIGVVLVNSLVTRLVKPRPLPKMNFSQGVPEEFKTLVVVPMMLLTPESIRAEVDRLEIRALANPEANLAYCLLADFSDAVAQRMPEDLELLDVAVRAISELNERHPALRFLLLYRERSWSESEGCWIGWERKRGKLEELNRLLVEEPGSEDRVRVAVGSPASLEGVRFVLTLDADTQLPRNTARKLIATLAHPLNRPVVSEDGRRVLRGYTIIQPRVSTSLPSANQSMFTLLFTDPTGTDPYSHAVSDVYQDLACSATFHGKGLYDLQAFHRVLGGRFPDSHVLSHDLLEGAHVRVGFASDIELLDQFPEDYLRFCTRLHRWTRGDWQIIDWLGRTVPVRDGRREPNVLPGLERWKIFDNLRRSLVPSALLAAMVVGLATPGVGLAVVGFALGVYFSPLVMALFDLSSSTSPLASPTLRELRKTASRSALFVAMLPHQAAVTADAVVRALVRRRTGRHLLEWATAPSSLRSRGVMSLSWVPVFAVVVLVLVSLLNPGGMFVAIPLAVLWAFSPALSTWLDRTPTVTDDEVLTGEQALMLRVVARQTWRFFDTFVGPQTNWLPPDNYQDSPRAEVAERTSPTNIGLYLASAIAAHELGYETCEQTIERIGKTVGTLGRLEKFRGHLLNWYETAELRPIGEKYVSSVDSANLIACVWCVVQGLEEILDGPLVDERTLAGLHDALRALGHGGSKLLLRPYRLEEFAEFLREARAAISPNEARGHEYIGQIDSIEGLLSRTLTWVSVLASPPQGEVLSLGPGAHELRRQALSRAPTLRELASGSVRGLTELIALRHRDAEELSPALRSWLDDLERAVAACQGEARLLVESCEATIQALRELEQGTDFRFLYDRERRLFAIGYNVSHQSMDGSYYDLIASEARLTSFLAVARGEVPSEHWWSLGRPFGRSGMRRTLLSWNGSMFEYLLPVLFTRSFAGSMLDDACRNAVDEQIEYGRKQGVPWGVSESAFSALDSRHVYQYKAFGVPELALRRTSNEDPVVAPYASALALMVRPKTAAANLRRLAQIGSPPLQGTYGFYDAIDYSRAQSARGEKGVVVQAWMAHHQGMVLLAVLNAVANNRMQALFHADPRVEATLPLLYERVPVSPPIVKTYSRQVPVTRLAPLVVPPEPGNVDTPDTPVPRAHLLSNGDMKVMVTGAGGGWLRWRDYDVTRWRADTTEDCHGLFCYFKDSETGTLWSAPHQPVCRKGAAYFATFGVDKASFRRRDRWVETHLEVVVAPDDDAEVRLFTLINHTTETRTIEVTSYAELALAPHLADRSHPAFSKLFVETEFLRDLEALVAWRRPRSSEEGRVFAGQIFALRTPSQDAVEFETDRMRFIGRGQDLRSPLGVSSRLSGRTGCVLDPVFSLRRTLTLRPGERVQLALVTFAAEDRDSIVRMAGKYRDWEAVKRAVQMSWTYAQLELRHLRIKPNEAQLYTQLCGHVIFPNPQMRAPERRLVANTLGQQSLWPHGISGDLPIVLVTIGTREHIDVVHEAIAAHEYWRMRGLVCDLVVLNEEGGGYENPLQTELERIVAARAYVTGVDKPGGVYVLRAVQLTAEERNLLHAVARVVFVAARGSLSQQSTPPTAKKPSKRSKPVPRPLSSIDAVEGLQTCLDNGTGGFSPDFREYVIIERPPRPWSNVLANETFGSLVTDSGLGCCWFGNSQANRITAWSNDPVADRPSAVLYVYEESLGAPVALASWSDGLSRVRHGLGYTVWEHAVGDFLLELTATVPVDRSACLYRLRIENRGAREARFFATLFAELVLGTDREHTQPHIVSWWDDEAEMLGARNVYNQGFGDCVAFLSSSRPPDSFTADRTEFLGRNGSIKEPPGAYDAPLSGKTGGGLDPCAAIKVAISVAVGASSEVVFTLGEGRPGESARKIAEDNFNGSLERVAEFWDATLGRIEVETPDERTNALFNKWLLYQNLACRFWGRTALYQSGGAYGFRDQLQDSLALLYTDPGLVRQHLLRCAARQFVEGDVQHWWHPESGAGVRTRISDDLLWLPYAVAQYVRVTGDVGVLDEEAPFLSERTLMPEEKEVYTVPAVSGEVGTLLEHCRRAVQRGVTRGENGLPLIGAGDWNDGLSNVGPQGRGESVWLAWFCIHVLNDYAELLELREGGLEAADARSRALKIAESVEINAWDGAWYLRGTYDDGTLLGSHTSDEAKIDSLPQSWAVISGAADKTRAQRGLRIATERLTTDSDSVIRLFTPPFDKTEKEPGYIKAYPPGVRENGGQYTHAAIWLAMAWARAGNGTEAVRLLDTINPLNHARDASGVARYQLEPYVVAADVYAHPDLVGMGGWSWYTGSAGWLYRVWLEEVFGFKLRGKKLRIEPVIPPSWPGFVLKYRFGTATYRFEIENLGKGAVSVVLDGRRSDGNEIELVDDGGEHVVSVQVGEEERLGRV